MDGQRWIDDGEMDQRTGVAIEGEEGYLLTHTMHIDTTHQPRACNQTFCCHPSRIGSMSVRPKSGQYVLTKCSCVSSEA